MIHWSSINSARQIQFIATTYNSPSNSGVLLRTLLAITQLEYSHGESIMVTLGTAISSVTETWWTILHLNCCKSNIRLEGGWTAQLQRFNDYFIAKLPTRASITMQPRQWKLFSEKFIFLNITTIADIVTICGHYITKEAYASVKSYESNHKWPRQQHFISKAHRELWTTCMVNITRQGSRHLHQPMGSWITPPTTIRHHRIAGDKLLTQQQDGSWLQHD